jgi:hypothetical protein
MPHDAIAGFVQANAQEATGAATALDFLGHQNLDAMPMTSAWAMPKHR